MQPWMISRGALRCLGSRCTCLLHRKDSSQAGLVTTTRQFRRIFTISFFTHSSIIIIIISLVIRDFRGAISDGTKSQMFLVPSMASCSEILYNSAKFVLVVEKDCSFEQLVHDNFAHRHNCIIVTGKGQPDEDTRGLVHKLGNDLPVLVLVDADPHGFEIALVYKCGSRSRAMQVSTLATPQLRILGVLPSDIERFRIPSDQLLQLSAFDNKKIAQLKLSPFFAHGHNAELARELDVMTSLGMKAEIQCLNCRDVDFLTRSYLPWKLQHNSWI